MVKRVIRRLTKMQSLLSTPRSALWISLYGTGITLFVNVTLTVVASTKFPESQGQRILFDGKCSQSSNLDTAIHFLINALSVILLTSSNYTMQYLSSPTRTELDKAHSKGEWLDIGVPSTRNLMRIERRRAFAWMILALTSVPLAILYNCVIFGAIDSNDYNAYVVAEEFFPNPTYDANVTHYQLIHQDELSQFALPEVVVALDTDVKTGQKATFEYETFMPEFIQNVPESLSNLRRLSNKECIQKYSTRTLTGHRHLLAVTKDRNTSIPVFANNVTTGNLLFYDSVVANMYTDSYPVHYQPFNYLCSGLPGYLNDSLKECSPKMIDSDEWNLFGYEIEYCMSEIVPQHCLLLFDQKFSIAVIGCNVLKMLCIMLAMRFVQDETLCTQGDILQSYLSKPDPSTVQKCLLDKSDVISRRVWLPQLHKRCQEHAKTYQPKTNRWFSAASCERWIFFLVIASASLVAAAVLLHRGLQTLRNFTEISLTSLWKLGFGRVDPLSLISSDRAQTGDIERPMTWSPSMVLILANMPQLLVSVLHLNYNSLFSCMLMEREWTTFAYDRKPLRVSSPVEGQRSTYFLSLPYRFSVPLIIASGLMHWLVSQSIYLAQINPNGVLGSQFFVPEKPDGVNGSLYELIGPPFTSNNTISSEASDESIRTWGYSCIGIVFVLILGCLMIATLLTVGAKKYRAGMPPAGHCSAVLSAACQRLPEDEDITQQPIMWGVVSEDREGVQHCAFSSWKVQAPALGALCR